MEFSDENVVVSTWQVRAGTPSKGIAERTGTDRKLFFANSLRTTKIQNSAFLTVSVSMNLSTQVGGLFVVALQRNPHR